MDIESFDDLVDVIDPLFLCLDRRFDPCLPGLPHVVDAVTDPFDMLFDKSDAAFELTRLGAQLGGSEA